MTLSIIGDRSSSATRPHIIQSSVDNAANETLLTATRCSKRKIADSTQDPLPVGKRLHSQSVRTPQSAYNEKLTSNEASKDKTTISKQKREKCPYDKSRVLQVSGILGKSKSDYICDLRGGVKTHFQSQPVLRTGRPPWGGVW
jgi:hypothetical protein